MDRPSTRLYVAQTLMLGEVVELSAQQAHHLGRVLRLASGSVLALFNENDGEWLGKLQQGKRGSDRVMVQHQRRKVSEESGAWLIFPPIRHHRLEFLIEKSSELGVTRLMPCLTSRTQRRTVDVGRMQRIAISAVEQCGRMSRPVCEQLRSLDEWLVDIPPQRQILYCAEQGEAEPLAEMVRRYQHGQQFVVLVGPEGGFSREEAERLASQSSVHAVGLGPSLLRVETAALMALSLVAGCSETARLRPYHDVDACVFPE